MVTAIETALAATPAGVVEVQHDGTRTKWDRAQAIQELEYWRRRAAAAAGKSITRSIDLSGAW
jgi:hypothetical protein